MPSSATPAPADSLQDLTAEVARLRSENEQLKHAVTSHALVDQAIGVVTALGRINPNDGFAVLRETSQHANIKLSDVAVSILGFAQGHDLPAPLLDAFSNVLTEHTAGPENDTTPTEKPDTELANACRASA